MMDDKCINPSFSLVRKSKYFIIVFIDEKILAISFVVSFEM